MEGLLRQAAETLNRFGSFVLPALELSFFSDKEPILLSEAKRISVDSCTVVSGVLRITAGGKPLDVAVNPDDALIEELENGSVSALMVQVEPEVGLEEQLVDGVTNKAWLYNLYAHKVFGWFLQSAEKMPIRVRGEKQHVMNCPIQARVFKGQPYASVLHDCNSCMFCVDTSESGVLYCTGGQRIAVVEDFKRTPEERKSLYDEFLQPDKTGMVASGLCPHCGGQLEEKNGENGVFLGCSHYPFCHFTAERKPDGGVSFNF